MATRTAWSVGIGAAVLAGVAFLIVPGDSTASSVLYQAVAVASLIVLLRAVPRVDRAARPVWLAIAGYALLSDVGDVVFDLQARWAEVEPYPGPADVFYLAAYVFAIAALVLLVRQVQRGRDLEAWIDTAILTVASVTTVGIYVIEPLVMASQESGGAVALSIAYPMLDILMLSGLVRLIAGRGRINTSVALITVAFTVTLVADLLFTYLTAIGVERIGPTWADALYLVAFVLVAAAAWAPGATDLAGEPRPGRAEFAPYRITALAIGALIVPVVMTVRAWSREAGRVEFTLAAIACVIVLALVLWRFRLLLDVVEGQSTRLAVLARTDALTGLPNRRTLDHELDRLDRASAGDPGPAGPTGPLTTAPLTIAMLDLDRFKDYNDQHGHQAGDRALAHCTRAWRAALPPDATLARYGGEEFALLLPGHDHDHAGPLLERVRAATPAPHTVSIGHTQQRPGETPYDTLNRADRALYQAKANGRNRVQALV
ncbi:MAG: GGDEF domain-containing protein [Candidatus Nanopelagicales bacterium]